MTLTYRLLTGDCRESMRAMEAESVDAIVSDPPYGLSFMGKGWDRGVPGEEFWREALRVAKPGAHLVAFGGTRTFHRLTCAIEDAGWEIRDCLSWLYGSGFPKSLNVAKAIQSGTGRPEDIRRASMGENYKPSGRGRKNYDHGAASAMNGTVDVDAPSGEWSGWGTALKPAWEPVILARKPLKGTVAANVQAHGTGALNIDACRVKFASEEDKAAAAAAAQRLVHAEPGAPYKGCGKTGFKNGPASLAPYLDGMDKGRWPANVLLDEEAAAQLDAAAGECKAGGNLSGAEPSRPAKNTYGEYNDRREWDSYGDAGGPSRFFYTSKASRAERNEGVTGAERRVDSTHSDGRMWDIPGSHAKARANFHPTVKPVDLMGWLCRLVTRPGGVILDPFMGSGSTGVAAIAGGFNFVGCEIEPEYLAIAKARIAATCPLLAKEIA